MFGSTSLRLTTSALLLAVAALPQTPPKLRLDGNVTPKEYSARLRIIPNKERFSGEIKINIEVRKPARVLWLNASDDIKIEKASLAGRPGKPVVGNADFQSLIFDEPVSSGQLLIRYTASISRDSSNGVFQMKDGSDWYVYTQFESISARRAFPCFDEPNYKVPWQLTLEMPRGQTAFSNTPVVSDAVSGAIRTIRFAKSRPLPSYLIAFAVGPFEVVPARAAGAGGTPIRIIVPKGRKAEAAFAVKTTPAVLEQVEKYFGIPYPYAKLDSIAVPLFGGAMENAGLITYNLPLILSKPEADSIRRQRDYVRVAVHEIGHQWFGDLVTLDWWNDIWLNEAFASWIEDRVLTDWKPDWGSAESAAGSRLRAMRQDGLVNARRIRQPIESNDDIANAFDGITYQKGAAVIRMFEAWLGPEKFRRGIKSYLDQYSDRNADVDKFLEVIGRSAGQEIAGPFASFLNQPGVPVVSIALKCEAGQPPSLVLSQERLLPQGSKGSVQQTWRVPVCVTYEVAGKRHRECTLLDSKSEHWTLPDAGACPAWVEGNADASGYYHVRYEGDLLDKILADGGHGLSASERVSTIGDISALVKAGSLSVVSALRLVPDFSRDTNRHIVSRTIAITEICAMTSCPRISGRITPDL